jgi:oligopeptidase A
MHPFLAPDFHIRWSTLVPEAVEPDIRHALQLARAAIDAICGQNPDSATYESTFHALECATEELDRGWGRLQHLDSVADTPAQRDALNRMLPEVAEFHASIPLNGRLWSVLKAYAESDEAAGLDSVRKRFIAETLADFRQAGADLPEEQKQRIAGIESELSKLTKAYLEHVLDSTNAWELVISDEARIDGLPDSAKAAALANAKAKGVATDARPAWRFTLQFPSMYPVLQHVHDESLRREVWEASVKVGAEGSHDNTPLVWRILELRAEKAALLGHDHFADLVLLRRMAGSGGSALGFVEDLHRRVKPAFEADYRQLVSYKAQATGVPADDLQPWDVAYWSERQRREHYDFDDETLRPYLPVDGVMAGMFEISSLLFGITITRRETVHHAAGSAPDPSTAADAVEVWHPEVSFYEIHDKDTGRHLGSFYADWHPRESKRGGAWMNSLHVGAPGEPHLALIIGNMSPPVDGRAALLTHREAETIFHEFGHLLHGLLSDVPVRSLAGTNVPRDFVELPSQFMENFCWDRRSLDFFARHHETDEPIPEELYARMLAARNYQSGMGFMRQLALARIDLEFHIHLAKWRDRDLDEADREILADYVAQLKTRAPSMLRRFIHLFQGPVGYAAGYYSYKWSEVLDADAFTRFRDHGVLHPESGRRFREHILSKGNSAPVDELYRRFMGRDPELEPLLLRAGLAGTTAA